MYSWRKCRSHCSLAACHVSGLRKERREERRGSPERVACRCRSHGSVSENEKRRKEEGGHETKTSPVDEHGTVFDRQAKLVARHRMKRLRVPLRQDVSGVVLGGHPLKVHHPLLHQLAHIVLRRPNMFRALPLAGFPTNASAPFESMKICKPPPASYNPSSPRTLM